MIGVGKIGLAMTKNFIKGGYPIKVFDPNPIMVH